MLTGRRGPTQGFTPFRSQLVCQKIGQDEATSDDGETGVIPRVISGSGAPAVEPARARSALFTNEESSEGAMRFAEDLVPNA